MTLDTIGFTKKSADRFFTLPATAGVKRVLGVRLNNTSSLAGFSKHPDRPAGSPRIAADRRN